MPSLHDSARHALTAFALVLTACSAASPPRDDETTQPFSPPASSSKNSPRTLLLIHAEHLQPVAQEWATYRESNIGGAWRVILHSNPPAENLAAHRADLQNWIRETHASIQPSPDASTFAVLLLGDAPSADSSPQGIPTWKFPQTDPSLVSGDQRSFISDHPYQLADDRDDSPDFPLGRIPAQTPEEARIALEKIKRYESTPPAALGRNRITYVAGEGHFGVMDSLLESLFKSMVDRVVPAQYDLSMTYAKASSIYCPPPSKLTQTVLDRMTGGSLLFNYVGHGFATGFDSLHYNGKRYPILRTSDLETFSREPHLFSREPIGERSDSELAPPHSSPSTQNSSLTPPQLPIAFMSCCSVGWFDLPDGKPSLAEAMLFHPNAPVAIIAGSRVTHPYANTILQMDITSTLLGGTGVSPVTGSGTGVSPVSGEAAKNPLPLGEGRSKTRSGEVRADTRNANSELSTKHSALSTARTQHSALSPPLTVGLLDLRAAHALVRIDPVDRELDSIAAPIAFAGKWKTSLKDLRQMHVKLYNLLGDPAMRIALPQNTITDLTIDNNPSGGRITGRIQNMRQGRIHLTFESPRTADPNTDKLQPLLGPNDPDLEDKAAINYPLANDRVLSRYEAQVIDGRFQIPIESIPASAATLRAYATGMSAANQPLDAIGALRLHPIIEPLAPTPE
ncbi:MAG: C25 family cysteine peptidase [Phycisphaerales bacterium]|nr:C25 family cysteine peptidase [Phycisphaerales bacterium]